MSQPEPPVSPRAMRAARGRLPLPFNMAPQPNVLGFTGIMVQPVSNVAPLANDVATLGNGYNNYDYNGYGAGDGVVAGNFHIEETTYNYPISIICKKSMVGVCNKLYNKRLSNASCLEATCFLRFLSLVGMI